MTVVRVIQAENLKDGVAAIAPILSGGADLPTLHVPFEGDLVKVNFEATNEGDDIIMFVLAVLADNPEVVHDKATLMVAAELWMEHSWVRTFDPELNGSIRLRY